MLDTSPPDAIDWITFVGTGEPTLNLDLDILIEGVKAMCDLPVAVITNGSLLGDAGVAGALLSADAVLPTLDAGSPDLFRRINRPPRMFTLERHVSGLAEFRRRYGGLLWIEVMLLKGINDSERALGDIADAVERIGPDAVHVLLPTRPPAEASVFPADEAGIARAREILEKKVHVLLPDERRGGFSCAGNGDLLDAVTSIVARHPMNEIELEITFHEAGLVDAKTAIAQLLKSGKIVKIERYGRSFFCRQRS